MQLLDRKKQGFFSTEITCTFFHIWTHCLLLWENTLMLHNSKKYIYIYIISAEHLVIDDAESVSPPHTPLSSGIRLIPDKEDPIDDFGSKYLY